MIMVPIGQFLFGVHLPYDISLEIPLPIAYRRSVAPFGDGLAVTRIDCHADGITLIQRRPRDFRIQPGRVVQLLHLLYHPMTESPPQAPRINRSVYLRAP